MPKNSNRQAASMRFESMLQVDVPKGRDGKHKVIIEQLLSDLHQLGEGNALKVPLLLSPIRKRTFALL